MTEICSKNVFGSSTYLFLKIKIYAQNFDTIHDILRCLNRFSKAAMRQFGTSGT